jgi:hypothetical protein
MKRITFFVFLGMVLILSFPTQATKVHQKDIEATHIVVGTIESVMGYFDVNEWGDELICSLVEVRVEKNLKGQAEHFVFFSIEGGQVGDLALQVSESPAFSRGDKVKLYLKKDGEKYGYFDHDSLNNPENSTAAEPGCCATFARWTMEPVSYYVNPANGDVSPSCAVDDIMSAAGSWRQAILLDYAGATNATRVKQNFANEIFFRKAKSGSTIAVTYTWYYTSTGQIIEFDIAFYDRAWKFFSLECDQVCNEGFYIQTIAAHEFGHGIGLGHNDCQDSLMYPYADFCGSSLQSSADLACAGALYAK